MPCIAQFGPGDFTPIIWITYWSFRWMIGLGAVSALISMIGLWMTRRKSAEMPERRANIIWRTLIWTAPLPLLAALVGWIFTEMGRQPWIVFGLMKTEAAVSPNVAGWQVALSLAAFTLIYGILAVVEFKLILKAAKEGPPEIEASGEDSDDSHLAIVY